MGFATIVIPNKWHFKPFMMLLYKGFHIVGLGNKNQKNGMHFNTFIN
jgi:hypothetical protein